MKEEKEIPTAKEIYESKLKVLSTDEDLTKEDVSSMMIEFAKLHRSNLIECFSERTSLSKEFLNGFYPESNIK